jgi:hypothetical protein
MEPIAHLESLARKRHVSQYHRMAPWLDLGRYDKWGPLLEEALVEHDPCMLWIRRGAIYDRWLSDPRFEGPLRAAGLPE